MNQPKKEWEEKFDEQWKPCYIGQVGIGGTEVSIYIKNFIHSLLSSQVREICESLEEMKRKITLREKGELIEPGFFNVQHEAKGFNHALSQAIERIKKEWGV